MVWKRERPVEHKGEYYQIPYAGPDATGLGIATLATLGTVVYRSNMEGALDDVPPDAAAAARESVDRAVDVAGNVSPRAAAAAARTV